jgi:ubiquinone/menaquinone biosynthesis C-methylase UbiE
MPTSGTPPPAYAIGQFRDAAGEVARLREQARVAARAEEIAFTEVGFPARGRGVDVGCGPGFVARRFLAGSELSIIGLDLDRQPLRLAREAVPVVQASAAALPIPSGALDFAYARLALRYVPEPERAVGELARVVRPGGGVFVLDSDDGALTLHPVPDGFADALAARHQTSRRRGGDFELGRKLPALFARAGLGDVRGRTITVSSLALGAEAFAALILGPVADTIDADLFSAERVSALAEAIRAWPRLPGAFGMMTAVLVAGTRPPDAPEA